ncbi:hypothetical protein BT69DRAFT_1281780, partial [Atractiella rhizophila]
MKVKEEGLQQVYRLHRYHHSDFWRPPLPSIHPESSANTLVFPNVSSVGETHQSLLRRQRLRDPITFTPPDHIS